MSSLMFSEEEDDYTETSIHDLQNAPGIPPNRYSSQSSRHLTTNYSPKTLNRKKLRKRSLSSSSVNSAPSSLSVTHVKSFPPHGTIHPRSLTLARQNLETGYLTEQDDDDDDVLSDESEFPASENPLQQQPPSSWTDEPEHRTTVSPKFSLDSETDLFSLDEGHSSSSSYSSSSSNQRFQRGDNNNNNENPSSEQQEGGRPRHWLFGVTHCKISWNRLASCVVRKAPCFWCCPLQQHNSLTYRNVLRRLTILCALFASVQFVLGLILYILIQNPALVDRDLSNQNNDTRSSGAVDFESNFEVLTNVWNLNGSVWFLGLLSAVVLVALVLTIRVIRTVNLVGAIRLLWLFFWVTPLMVFFIVGLFDSFLVTDVWIRFWWRDRTMAWFRNEFCEAPYANTKCAVPVFVDENDETQWCMVNFNGDTDCVTIRDDAQFRAERFVFAYYYLNAGWAIGFVILIFLSVKTLENIISRPLVQKSRESNMPIWLLLPIAGSGIMGVLYSFSPTSVLNTRTESRSEASWIGPVFIAAGSLFFMEAVLACMLSSIPILKPRDKRRKQFAILVFIAIAISLLIILTTIFAASVAFMLSLEELSLSDALRGDIACFIDQGSCTNCDGEGQECPEWTNEDVKRILQTQTKAGAALAGIFLLYASGCLRYGINLRRHVNSYQIDYV